MNSKDGVDSEIVDLIKGGYDKMNENGDGLNFEEFVELTMALFDDEEAEQKNGKTSGLQDMFNLMDMNGDGVLDKHEVYEVTKNEMTKEQLDHLWLRVDTNQDKVVDYPEFEKSFQGGVAFQFDMMDMNLDGNLLAPEMVEFDMVFGEGSMTLEDAENIVAYIDENTNCGPADGAIQKSEFLEFVEGKTDCQSEGPTQKKALKASDCKGVMEAFKSRDENKNKYVDFSECLDQDDKDSCTYLFGFAQDPVMGLTLNEVYKAFNMQECIKSKH
jgi:hypothetical protein